MSPNKNYEAGRREEYACMARWREKGYTPVRSAGSHGPWDVCAVMSNRSVALIQCKVVTTPATANRLLKEFTENPPLAPSERYHQVLEVKIKGTSTLLSITV